MNINIDTIFKNKIKEIEDRLPISFDRKTQPSFNSYLQKSVQKNTTLNNSDINSAVSSASKKYNVSEDLIHAVIKQESSYNKDAVSKCGAQGLMQLMPETAKALGVTNAFDIYQNIDAGTKYLSQQLQIFNGDISLALAAYNAGPNAIKKYGGIPPYSETQNYVKKILNSLSS